MTRVLMLLACITTACAAGAPVAEHEARSDDLRSAQEAYQAYCSLCRTGGPCCLQAEDFAPERWSNQSTAYLRAFRGYYECEYSDTSLEEAQGMNAPATDPQGFPTMRNLSRNCQPHACQSYQATMQSELDRALATRRPHAPGALVACSASN
jgi:hypothetical protein